MGIVAPIIVAFLSIFLPGILLSFALLRKTELHTFEISVIGLIFGLIGPATLTWLESYLRNYIHFFSFSLALFELNVLVLTTIGAALCWQQGVFGDFSNFVSRILGARPAPGVAARAPDSVRRALSRFERGRSIVKKHEEEEKVLREKQSSELKLTSSLSAEERQRIESLHKEDQRRLREEHDREELMLLNDFEASAPKAEGKSRMWIVWSLLLALMLITFYSRIINISTSPTFFEFDPYFDMLNTESILTYGYQPLLSPMAWPVVPQGTVMRLEPLIPYLEAYWYDLANMFGQHLTTFSTNLMSYTSSFYPPIAAALLVFVVFMLLYHEYDARIGLLGAALTMMMPVLYTTFIAGEQLVEPWGILALFFFLASYVMAVRNPGNKRLAVLTGIAFVSNFLGAHYYTVTAGVLAIYLLVQGIINIIRKDETRDFYTSNAIILAVIILFYVIYDPYGSTLANRIPALFGIPTIVSFPLFALIFVIVAEYLSKRFAPMIAKSRNLALGAFAVFTFFIPAIIVLALLYIRNSVDRHIDAISRTTVVAFLAFVITLLVLFTPLGHPIRSYLNLSARFTTPSKPLFMTVQEYIPTGLFYNFGAQGFGAIGANTFGIPLLVWLISGISLAVLALSIIFRNSKTGILYFATALPLMFAGFSEVKYLPHLGVAYIILLCIILGELAYLAQEGFKLRRSASSGSESISPSFYSDYRGIAHLIIVAAVFFVFGALAASLVLVAILGILMREGERKLSPGHIIGILIGLTMITASAFIPYLLIKIGAAVLSIIIIVAIATIAKLPLTYSAGFAFLAIILLASVFGFASHFFVFGESGTLIEALRAAFVYGSNPSTGCSTLINNTNIIGESIFCNQIPRYWLNSMAWIRANVGPYAPRVLSWWDYGDWINWFGNSNAVLRGDNAVATEDYATAANLVLGLRYNFTPQRLAKFMNLNQTKYLLLDQDLISKWQALDFLACIHINATSQAFAKALGAQQAPPAPYTLGGSHCELGNDPQLVLVPLAVFIRNATQSLSYYCSISTAQTQYALSYLVTGNSATNATVCVRLPPNANGVFNVYNSTGGKMNAVIQTSLYEGTANIGGAYYAEFVMLYLPGANGTVANPPTGFYSSNFYRAFILGNLPGFTLAYPQNGAGINYLNGTWPVRIFSLNNYTGGLPPVPQKPSWVHNNYTMP